MDLILMFLLILITAPVVELTDGVPRIILGVLFILVLPGYSLVAALFPHRDSLEGVERAALSLLMSFCLVALSGLVLNYTPWKINLTPVLFLLSGLVICFIIIAFYRRSRLMYEDRFRLTINIKLPQGGSSSKLDKTLYFGLAVSIIIAMTVLGFVIAKPKNEEPFTDFYILGSGEMMENYPQTVVLGDEASVILGIKNHENQDVSYNVVVTLGNKEVYKTDEAINLGDEEEWQSDIHLVPTEIGDNQYVEFLLYRITERQPYLALHMWLDVRA